MLHKLFSRPLNHQQTTQARAEKNVSAIAVVEPGFIDFVAQIVSNVLLKIHARQPPNENGTIFPTPLGGEVPGCLSTPLPAGLAAFALNRSMI